MVCRSQPDKMFRSRAVIRPVICEVERLHERMFAIFQATEEVSKSLVAMKEILYGTNEKEPQTEAVAQLAQELYNSGLLSTLIADLQLIDFEVRA